jgi:hypothetical protein
MDFFGALATACDGERVAKGTVGARSDAAAPGPECGPRCQHDPKVSDRVDAEDRMCASSDRVGPQRRGSGFSSLDHAAKRRTRDPDNHL